MELDKLIRCYEQAAAILPLRLRKAALALPDAQKTVAEELRLRAGGTLTVLLPDGEMDTGATVEAEDLETLCDLATEFSRYAAMETLRCGFLSVRGGCRVGLCGSAVMKDGVAANLKEFSSASIRIAREQLGVGREVAAQLFSGGQFCSTLLLSPPGGGKTTLLRDLIRCLSAGDGTGHPPLRVAVADERGEVAVCFQGRPQMNLGPRTDVLDGCPKALAIPMLLRSMNPQLIAVDEITVRRDIEAMTQAANCGVGLLATIHAGSVAELTQKPLFAEVLAAKVFRVAVQIRCGADGRRYTVESLPC